MLTARQMKAAIYARACDLEPNFETGLKAAEYDEADGWSMSVDQYNEGKDILAQYTLRYDYRSTVHTMASGKIPGQDDGVSTLRVTAGYVGTMQAYQTAIFNVREVQS